MKIIPIPVKHEWIENLFGTEIADHFNEISLALFLAGFLFWVVFLRKPAKKKTLPNKPIQKQREFTYRMDEEGHIVPDHSYKPDHAAEDQPIAEEYFGQYDRYSDLTDEEMRLAMQIRIERTHPTYEEWRAQRLAEKAQEEAQRKDAAAQETPTE